MFAIGLVCGHLKTSHYSDFLGWQLGIPVGSIDEIDFRVKMDGCSADDYGVRVRSYQKKNAEVVKPMKYLRGVDWGLGYFKLRACDFCDDVFAETADITMGDAWLPSFRSDSAGTNIVVVRSRILAEIVSEGIAAHELHLRTLTSEEVVESQRGGVNHRKESLPYRLYLADKFAIWRPRKRVSSNRKAIGFRLRVKQRFRMELEERSHKAFCLLNSEEI